MNEVERLLKVLKELEQITDLDPETFGQDCSPSALRETLEAWQAVTALCDLYIARVRQTRGIGTN